MTKYTNSEKRIIKALRDGAGDTVPSDNLHKRVAQIVVENSYDKQKSEGRWNEFMTKYILVGVGGLAVVVLAIVGFGMLGGQNSDSSVAAVSQEIAQFVQDEVDLAEFDDDSIEGDLAALAFLDDDAVGDDTNQVSDSSSNSNANSNSNSAQSATEAVIDVEIEDLDFDLELGDLTADDIVI